MILRYSCDKFVAVIKTTDTANDWTYMAVHKFVFKPCVEMSPDEVKVQISLGTIPDPYKVLEDFYSKQYYSRVPPLTTLDNLKVYIHEQ